MSKIIENVLKGVFTAFFVGIIVFIIVAVLAALPMMFLWNWLMPAIFGLTTITFWQSFGLVFLSSLMFKSSYIKK
jgi:hypothetical protein